MTALAEFFLLAVYTIPGLLLYAALRKARQLRQVVRSRDPYNPDVQHARSRPVPWGLVLREVR